MLGEVRDVVAMSVAAGVALLFVLGLVLAQLLSRGRTKQIPLVLICLLAATALPVAVGLTLFVSLKPALEVRGMSGNGAITLCLGVYALVVAACVACFVWILGSGLKGAEASPAVEPPEGPTASQQPPDQ